MASWLVRLGPTDARNIMTLAGGGEQLKKVLPIRDQRKYVLSFHRAKGCRITYGILNNERMYIF